MNREQNDKAVLMTKNLMESYWHGDLTLLYQCMHPDIMWIGSMENEYVFGAEAMKNHIEAIVSEMPDVHLMDQEYTAVHSDDNTVVVSGRYHAFTDASSGFVLSEKQRGTFIWKYCQNEFKLIHLHISNNLHIQDVDEKFPVRAGKETYEYMQKLLKSSHKSEKVEIVTGAYTHYIDASSIIYIEAMRAKSIVFCVDKAITTNAMIGELEKVLSGQFYRLHRGYLINCAYVSSITRFSLLLTNGISIPIPEKRYTKVKTEIENIIKNLGGKENVQ